MPAGVMGGFAGKRTGLFLGSRKGMLGQVFGITVVTVGSYVVWRSLL